MNKYALFSVWIINSRRVKNANNLSRVALLPFRGMLKRSCNDFAILDLSPYFLPQHIDSISKLTVLHVVSRQQSLFNENVVSSVVYFTIL
jgi:hypothetical protein